MINRKKRIIVEEGDRGLRLDAFLSRHLSSRSLASKMIKNHSVELSSGEIKKPSHQVVPGEEFFVTLPQQDEKEITFSPVHLKIEKIYEDKHIVIVNKPANLVVHPGAGGEKETLVHAMKKDTELSPGTGPRRPGIVHRLDKGVSGLMILSKTREAEQKLILDFKSHFIERHYKALGMGKITATEGVVDNYIGRHPKDRKRFFCFNEPVPGAKKAVTCFKVLKSWHLIHLFDCRPKTGRTHQIRLHLHNIGVSLLGDQVYGQQKKVNSIKDMQIKNKIKALKCIALYASDLMFKHPVTHKKMKFSIPWPNDLNDLVQLFNFHIG